MESENRGPALASLAIVASAAALGWIALSSQEGDRVADPRPFTEVLAREQDVVARLWEDPLQAVQSDIAQRANPRSVDRKGNDTTLDKLARSVVEERAGAKICLLVVCLPDTPFPGDLEVRLRTRYAVQMAMAQQQYAPEFQDRLGYFAWNPEARRTRPEDQSVLYMPFEWFSPVTAPRSGETRASTLVLWLPESWLLHDPFGLLAALRSKLVPQDEKLADMFLIGPRSSNTLGRMIVALGDPAGPPKTPRWPALQGKFAIFSPQATAPDQFLDSPLPGSDPIARRNFGERLKREFGEPANPLAGRQAWTYFFNTIAPDDQLTAALADELALRGALSTASKDKSPKAFDVLVLAEADTSYGRSLPLALQNSLNAAAGVKREADTDKKATQNTLSVYRYLRGLDQQKGQSSTEADDKGSPPATTEALLAKLFTRHSTMPLGESQLDYVERLADQIERDVRMGQNQVAATDTNSRISQVKAVGVLGSDIYDKLILLRSLRPRFPKAVFFTTDLDARLWHPDHLPYTRNMVVATAYGVSPADYGDEKIAPFRDAYQLAVFRACQAALGKAANPQAEVPQTPGPRMYEIGRNGPVGLRLEEHLAGAEEWVPSRVPLSARQRHAGYVLAAGLVGFLGLWLVHDRIVYRSKVPQRWRGLIDPDGRWILCACAGPVALFVFWLIFVHLSKNPGGEPWAWTEGVSIWPTEMVRVGIIFAVLSALFWSWHRFLRTRDRLANTYFPGLTVTPKEKTGTWAALLAPWRCLTAAVPNSSPVACGVFQTYLNKGRKSCRFIRVFSAALLYLAFLVAVLMLFGASGGNPQIRGPSARLTDGILTACSALASLGLLFYVLDAVALCTRLLRSICGAMTVWPESLVRAMCRRYSVRPADASGFLDVQFSAEISKELGKLVLFPFLVQLLFLLSRNRFFDNWTWSGPLVAVYVGNLLVACLAWFWLRRTARTIRDEALKNLEEFPGATEAGYTSPCDAKDPDWVNRRNGVANLKREIEGERRGAYAKFFQDPALIAMVLPSGVVGCLMVIVRAFFDLS